MNNFFVGVPFTGCEKYIDENSITVNLTPIGSYQRLYISNIKDNKVFVGSDNDIVDFNYTVYAERKDVDRLTVEF